MWGWSTVTVWCVCDWWIEVGGPVVEPSTSTAVSWEQNDDVLVSNSKYK